MKDEITRFADIFDPYLENPYTQEERKEIVAQQLINLRKEYRLTQKEISDIIGVTPQAYSGYEKAKYEPSMETLVRIAYVFKISTDYLLCKSKNPFTNDGELEEEAREHDEEKIDAIKEEIALMRARIEELEAKSSSK